MNYLAQIGWHGINVMTFRHRGQGLEQCSPANCYTLSAISTIFVTLALIAEGNPFAGVMIGMLFHVAYMVLAIKMFSRMHVAGIACALAVFAVFRTLGATVAVDILGPESSVFRIWEPLSLIVFIIRSGLTETQGKKE